FFEIKAGIAQGLPPGVDTELNETVGAAQFLGRGESGSWVETLYFSGDLAIVPSGVEQSDFVNAAFTRQEVAPHRLDILAQGGHHSRASHHHSAFRPMRHKKRAAKLCERGCPGGKGKLLLLAVLDVFDDVTDALELFGFFVGNF